jgi:hypothetical protein
VRRYGAEGVLDLRALIYDELSLHHDRMWTINALSKVVSRASIQLLSLAASEIDNQPSHNFELRKLPSEVDLLTTPRIDSRMTCTANFHLR